jgi:hypothetical protein
LLSSKYLKVLEARDEKLRLHVEFATRFATRKCLDIDSVGKSGGREGFIPASKVLVFQPFPNIPAYPYLRKYLTSEGPTRITGSESYAFRSQVD